MLDSGAILGKKGAGKSSVARFMFEHELDVGHRCCFVDPMGDAAGIRLNPDKTPSRFQNVIIFGGDRGDIPISPEDGAKVGRIVAETAISCLIDLSNMGQGEQQSFMGKFADVLYDKIRTAVTLFIDEAHIFAPQDRADGNSFLLNRMARLNAQGRKRGIFLWFMTQRPARLNKNVLGGTDTFIAMKVLMPLDVERMVDWFQSHGPEKVKEVKAQLSTLKPGEAIVYASTDGFFKRVQFPMHSTLDTGRTPRHGEPIGDFEMPKTDIGDLGALFASMDSGDPKDDEIKALKGRVNRLEASVGDLRGQVDRETTEHRRTRDREEAILDILTDTQNRVGFVIGSPLITPGPANGRYEDYFPVLEGDRLTFQPRHGRNHIHVGAAKRRMITQRKDEE